MSRQHADRRTFLTFLTAAGAAAALRCGTSGGGAAGDTGRSGGKNDRKVIVLGAGLAGLTAAYNLMNSRYDVIVLEGQNRVGGRVLTAREGLRDGCYAEMGAVRIFDNHEYTNRYIKRFELPLAPYESGDRAFYLGGRRFRPPPAGRPWPIPTMSAAERADPSAFFEPYLLSGIGRVGKVFDPGWPNAFPSALELDKVTIGQYIRGRGASAGWLDWFQAHEGNLERVNACAGFAMESVAMGETVSGIRGGNDRLPAAFAQALGDRVVLGSRVVRIEQSATDVAVTYIDARGVQNQLRASHCVCALPFSTLRKVVIATPFADDKMAAIQNLKYMAVARCYFQTKSRFWQEDPLGRLGGLNIVGTDTFAGRIWDMSAHQPAPAVGLVHAYMVDEQALEYAAKGSTRIEATRRYIEANLLPGLTQDEVVARFEKLWQDDPWVGGGWGWTQPNEMRTMFHAMRRPEGRVHFAGEHTSIYIGWMNGAIESGERAAREVLQA